MPDNDRTTPAPLLDVTGRVALVTGASRGIGRAIALGLAAHGADVLVHCASRLADARAAADAIAKEGGRARVLQRDLTGQGSGGALAAEAMAAFGRVDILVLNAIRSGRHPFETLGQEEIAAQVATNLMANLEILQACVPAMAGRGWGRVVTIGSIQQVRPNPQLVVYAALKSAMLNVMINLTRH
jgi:NAD(P)-dependent dehydrogenase (short-subunit alcohol dehydrogenase family)